MNGANLIQVLVSVLIYHHITGLTIVIAQFVSTSVSTLLHQHSVSRWYWACLGPTVPSLFISISCLHQTLFSHSLCSANQVGLFLYIVLVPVQPSVVGQLINWQHWLPPKHQGVRRDVCDTVRGSVVDHNQMGQCVKPFTTFCDIQ